MSDYDDYVEEVTNDLCMWADYRPLMPEMVKALWDIGLTITGKTKSPKAFSSHKRPAPSLEDVFSSSTDMCLQMYLSCVDDNDIDVKCTITWIDAGYWDPRDITKTHILDSVEIIE